MFAGVDVALSQTPSPGKPKLPNLPMPSSLPPSIDSLSLDSLATMELDSEKFTFDESEFIQYYSHGWFATPYRGISLSFFNNFVGFRIDDAPGIRPEGIIATHNGFSPRNPFDERRHRWVLKQNSGRGERDSDYENEYPLDDGAGNRIGLRIMIHLPIPAFLRIALTYDARRGLLYSSDRTKSYLSDDGVPTPFHEVNVLEHNERVVGGSFGLTLPIYGAFFKPVEDAALASYYYVYFGGLMDYAFDSRTTQYTQIADAKTVIRYQNGLDTLRLLSEARLPGLSQWRPSAEIAVGMGWNFGATFPTINVFGTTIGGSFGAEFSIEGYAQLPFAGIFANGLWKQYTAGVRMTIGYQWIY
jgi:hypothetical protein